MKHSSTAPLVATLFLGFLGGCDSTGPSPSGTGKPSDSTVHKDSTAPRIDTTSLTSDTGLPGSKSQVFDTSSYGVVVLDTLGPDSADWYRAEVRKDSCYAVYAFGLASAKGIGKTDPRLDLFWGTNNSSLGSSDDVGASRDPIVVFRAPATGRIRIRIAVGSSRISGAYQIKVLKVDRYEPDDLPSLATPIAADGSWQLHEMEVGGSDWFSISTKVGGFYEVQSNSDQTVLSFQGPTGDPLPVTNAATTSGVAYRFQARDTLVRFVAHPVSGISKDFHYAIRVAILPNDTFEFDGSPKDAKVLPVNDLFQRHAIAEYDVDWMKIPVRKGFVYQVEMMDLGTVDAFLVPDTSMPTTTLAFETTYSRSGIRGVSYQANQDGYLFLEATSQDTATYLVRAKEYPGDPSEPDGLTNAPPLPVGTTPATRYLMAGEIDWFSFMAVKGTVYSAILENPDQLPINVSVYSMDLGAVAADLSDGTFPCPKDGMYFFKLSGSVSGPYSARLGKRTGSTTFPIDSGTGTRTFAGSVDWVKIHLDSTKDYRFTLLNLQIASKLTLSLCGLDSVEVRPSFYVISNSTTVTGDCIPPRSGDYLLKASTTSLAASSMYSLGVATIPTDIYERDDKLSTASRIATDSSIQHRLTRSSDQDWVAFQVDSGWTYTVAVTGNTSQNTIQLMVFNADSLQVGIYTSDRNPTFTMTAGSKGTRYARISPDLRTIQSPFGYDLAVKGRISTSKPTEPVVPVVTTDVLPLDGSSLTSVCTKPNGAVLFLDAVQSTTYTVHLTTDHAAIAAIYDPDDTSDTPLDYVDLSANTTATMTLAATGTKAYQVVVLGTTASATSVKTWVTK